MVKPYIATKIVICIMIIATATRRKVFNFGDHWYISKEYVTTGKLWLFHVIIAIISAIISFIANTKFNNHHFGAVSELVFTYSMAFMIFERCYISVFWVVRNNSTIVKNDDNDGISNYKYILMNIRKAIGNSRNWTSQQ